MADNPNRPRPKVNPIMEGLSVVLFFAAIITAVVVVVSSWFSDYRVDDSTLLIVLFASFLVAFSAWRYYRSITFIRDEWDYRKSAVVLGEEVLTINDQFCLSQKFRSSDNPSTCLLTWIVSGGRLYMVHPFEEEKFRSQNLGIGSVIRASMINENGQFKIFSFAVITKSEPNARPNNLMKSTGVITEKYYGSAPSGLADLVEADFPGIIRDARINQDYSATIRLSIDQKGIRVTSGPLLNSYFVRINGYFEQVSAADFLAFRTGDVATFIRDEKTGFSVLRPG